MCREREKLFHLDRNVEAVKVKLDVRRSSVDARMKSDQEDQSYKRNLILKKTKLVVNSLMVRYLSLDHKNKVV